MAPGRAEALAGVGCNYGQRSRRPWLGEASVELSGRYAGDTTVQSGELLQANGTVHQTQAQGECHQIAARDPVAVDLPALGLGIGHDGMAAGAQRLDGFDDRISMRFRSLRPSNFRLPSKRFPSLKSLTGL